MKKILKSVKERIEYKKKYNTLKLKYDVLQEEYEKKVVELNTERRINQKRKAIWESKLKEQETEIVSLKKRKRKNVANSKK